MYQEMWNKFFSELNQLLLNKTVKEISPCGNEVSEGGVCKITTTDNGSFNICANDLGVWIVKGQQADGYYTKFNELVDSYSNHYNSVGSTIIIENGIVNIGGPDGKDFFIKINNLTDWEKKIVLDPNLHPKLLDALPCGSFWAACFPDIFQ